MARQQIAAYNIDFEPAQAPGSANTPAPAPEASGPTYDARDLHAFLETHVARQAASNRRLPPIAGLLLAFGAGAAIWAFIGGLVLTALR